MGTNWGSKLGNLYSKDLGVGVSLPPGSEPKPVTLKYSDFRKGLMLADRPSDIPEGFYTRADDIETSRDDKVIRAPGVTLVEDTGHSLQWMAVHSSLDFQSVLLAFDAPYLGVKEAGNFVWSDKGLDTHGAFWVASLYGDKLLFSNGRISYARDFDLQTVAVVPNMPGAGTIFTVFGRAFAGNILQAGQYNVLGVAWNGVSGDYTDWTGSGSGSELLIADVPRGDKIIAGRLISYSLAAILCRHSLWIAEETDVFDRPANFKFRIIGIGCVAEPTARTTEAGVTFLSDEGVRHFDGNNAPVISSGINAELLPLDTDNLHLYKSEWIADRRRYILTTPTATYIYQFPTGEYPQGAWFKRTLVATNVVAMARQVADQTWDDMGNLTWDQMWQTWGEMGTPELDQPPDIFFASGTRYGIQDEAAQGNFGALNNPIFQPRPANNVLVDLADEVLLTETFLVEYSGSGTIELIGIDELGNGVLMALQVLPAVDVLHTITIESQVSTRALGIFVRIADGFPKISSIRQVLLDNGPVLSDSSSEELLDEASTDLLSEADTTLLWP